MTSYEYIRTHYQVPAKRGMRVVVDGKYGRITGFQNQYILVKFDDARFSVPCHPTWRVVYLGKEPKKPREKSR